MITTALSGFGAGLSLIVAIGAQNAYVLRQGIRREHAGAIALLCALADALLMGAGVLGIGTLVERFPAVLEVLRWGGVAFLVTYALLALRRALRPKTLTADASAPGLSLTTALATAAALTFLNPHVYLDTVLLLGSLANQHGADGRWVFATGAAIGSFVWFFGLAYGARSLAPVFARPAAWRVLDAVIAAIMLLIAIGLASGPLAHG